MKSQTLKILLFLLTLHSLSLYFYFFYFSPSVNRHHSPDNILHNRHTSVKPWPILPSYLPWTQNPNIPFRSCEAYFGNGFTRRVDVLRPISSGGGGGWFRCFYSETLRSSICEGGRIQMVPGRILMSRGGEKLESVIGRGEDEELPNFGDGAFQIQVGNRSRIGEKMVDREFLDKYVEEGEVERHTMRELIESIRLVSANDINCSKWIEEPTLFVTRFEYANLFHTVTDWYSAYVASRVTGLPYRPHLVFLDGHCETQLEETWRALFSSLTYAKNFNDSVCFRHAIMAPLGYETPLFKGLTERINCHGASAGDLWRNPDDKRTARISEFGEMIRAAFGFRFPIEKNRTRDLTSSINILVVRREDYLAHPRHGGKVQTRLSNEQEVYESIKNWGSNHPNCKLNVVNGIFAHMHMKEQIRAIQEADVIVGAHGAGLTHIVSAMPKAVILEIISSEYRRPHFGFIATWKGLEYHPIFLETSYADPRLVIDKLSWIVRNLGC